MPNDIVHADQTLLWSVAPNDTDWLAWGAIIAIALAFYLVMFLYAKFDRWADHHAEGTPLAKTIPTMLGVALLYEIFPLDHFSILLPLSAILIAVAADWMRHGQEPMPVATEPVLDPAESEAADPVPDLAIKEQLDTSMTEPESKEAENV